ncbi:uncharacterized protein KQ657_001173 [Scheffersomyces spartinae]|uniref:Aminoacyl-transfer RNA synthetases class-II family profile domain-containing protein n=1 Tax=Scheffersomyces spartinae TaxID=45513 RepID=A0A9P7V800_9ASCO|nr:uncharacterized protein KQ657_001173 [Scheffersomyces spartinae]KAG7193056.1 hypothetical protein KQ657_001173 [Scheffersomyces spartinae]
MRSTVTSGWTLLSRAVSHSVSRRYSLLPEKKITLEKFEFPSATHTIAGVTRDLDNYLDNQDAKIILNGHMNRKPKKISKLGFAELRDGSGDGQVVQLMMSPETTDEKYLELLKTSKPEDSVAVIGYAREKQTKGNDFESKEKQWELVVEKYQVLNPSTLEASRLDYLKHTNPEDIPPHLRYLQLRTPFYQKTLRTRSKVAQLVRNTLIDDHEFVEIETPLLFKSTPEGAREFLVPTRTPERFYALPQSPQQYKQILMSSGFTKYFQIARCFRDEDLRADRQPEFTQIDLEMSFINNKDQICRVVEDIVNRIWNEIGGLKMYTLNDNGEMEQVSKNDKLRFSQLSYIDALTNYGIDKPDLRYQLKFHDLSKHFEPMNHSAEFPIVEACILRGAFDPTIKKPKIPKALSDHDSYTRRAAVVIPITNDYEAKNWFKGLLKKEWFKFKLQTSHNETELLKELDLKPGDIIALATRAEFPYENPTPLGRFRQLAIQNYPTKWLTPIRRRAGGDKHEISTDYDPSKVFIGTWVVDFPLFSPVEINDLTEEFPQYSATALESTHHPFTMAKTEDYDYLESNPKKVHGEHYDLVINGVEVGGGSRRIHDFNLQQYVFENILGITNYDALFGHLLKALSMGCPPHAGLALGFDRLCAMLVGSSSIRDVIAFPKNQKGVDPVIGSPSDVPDSSLSLYYIKKDKENN